MSITKVSAALANLDGGVVINESSADADFRVESNGNANMLFVDGGNDRVGIGTGSPSTNLHIYSTADNAPHLLLENFQNADTDDAAVIELYLNDQTTGGISDDTDVGVIRFTGDEKDAGGKETYAEIRGVAHDPGSGSSNKGHLSFFVQAAGDLNETLKLDEDKVVIGGDAVPDELLHIYDRNAAPKIRFEQFDSSGAPTSGDVVGGIEWSINDDSSFSGADTVRTKILSVIEGTTAQTALTFSTGASSAASAEKMRLTNDGKLGIGTASPARNLVVSSSGQTDLSILAGTSASAQLQFGDSDDDNIGQIEYNNSTNAMMITTNASEAMRILSTGRLAIGTTTSDSPVTIGDSNTGSYSGTSYMKGTLRLYHSSNTDNRYVGISMTHNGSTEGMFGYQRTGTANDLADFVWQGYDGNSNSYKELFRIKANGDLEAIDTSIASNSDERLKENIEDFTGGLDLISKLKPRTFTWKEPKQRKEGTVRGFVAQEVLDVDDYWVSEQEAKEKEHLEYKYTKDTETVYLSKLNDKDAMYVSAIQEQQKTIEKLIKRIETLESK